MLLLLLLPKAAQASVHLQQKQRKGCAALLFCLHNLQTLLQLLLQQQQLYWLRELDYSDMAAGRHVLLLFFPEAPAARTREQLILRVSAAAALSTSSVQHVLLLLTPFLLLLLPLQKLLLS